MKRLPPLLLIALLLLIWEAVAQSGRWSPLLFPSLARIFNELFQFLGRTDSLLEAWVSLQRAFAGFALAALAGVLLFF